MAARKDDKGAAGETPAAGSAKAGDGIVLPEGARLDGESTAAVSARDLEAAQRLREQRSAQQTRTHLVVMRMGELTIPVPQGTGIGWVTVQPFHLSPELTRHYAQNLIRRFDPNRRYDPQTWSLDFAPPPEPEGYVQESFVDKASGRRFLTNGHAPPKGTKGPRGNPLFHSIRQAQHFVAGRRTIEAIERYLEEFDDRAEVLVYATAVIRHRQKLEAELLEQDAVRIPGVMA